jgi:molecular chaperone HscB
MSSPLAQDFFTLFGLPRAYRVDVEQLKVRYRDLQQAMHPDRFANAPSLQRRYAVQLAAHINEAFETLRHPLHRLRYLLELNGVQCGEDGGPRLGAEFLAAQMQWREDLEALKGAGVPHGEFKAFRTRLDDRLDALQTEAEQALSGADDDRLQRALVCYREMQFMYRLREDVAATAEKFDR